MHAPFQNAPRAALRDQWRALRGFFILASEASGRGGFQGRVADHADDGCRLHGTRWWFSLFGCRKGRGDEETRSRGVARSKSGQLRVLARMQEGEGLYSMVSMISFDYYNKIIT